MKTFLHVYMQWGDLHCFHRGMWSSSMFSSRFIEIIFAGEELGAVDENKNGICITLGLESFTKSLSQP